MTGPPVSPDLAALVRRLPSLRRISVAGRRVLVRADLNLPADAHGDVTDDGRLRALQPTLDYLLDQGARVILASHRGRPEDRLSLGPVARRLGRLLGQDLPLAPEVIGPRVTELAANLQPGRVLVLENLRFHPGEMARDMEFAQALADLADIYVNDAFGATHRDHASITGVTELIPQAVAGFQLQNELAALARALVDPARPFAAILGGSSIGPKLPALTNLLALADKVLLGGLLGQAFVRALFHQPADESALSGAEQAEIERLAEEFCHKGFRAKFYVPIDCLAVPRDWDPARIIAIPAQELPPHMLMGDIGPATRLLYQNVLAEARTIVWNGPLGAYERGPFSRGTTFMAQTLAQSTGLTIAGGADTSAALIKAGTAGYLSYLSTGGSAFIELLAGRPLVGLEALLRRSLP